MNVNIGSREIWHVELAPECAFPGIRDAPFMNRVPHLSACLIGTETTALKMLVYGREIGVQITSSFPFPLRHAMRHFVEVNHR
jgi:hypothetical protein